jgi:hypothetical protein
MSTRTNYRRGHQNKTAEAEADISSDPVLLERSEFYENDERMIRPLDPNI